MTTAATGRVRRSIRYARMEAGTEAAARESVPRRERMRVTGRLEMPEYQHTQDWTGGMGVSPSGRFQVVEHPRRRRAAVSGDGIRMDWAKTVIWVLAAVFAVVILTELASMGIHSVNIRKLDTRIEAAQGRNLELQSQLAASSGDISVCTRAVELNLISSGGARTIQLTAPREATMTLVETQDAQTTHEPELRASVGN